MRKLCFLIAATFIMSSGFGQEQPKSGKRQQPAVAGHIKKSPASPRTPSGPSGFGPLRIGMTKAEIESLQATDGTYLASQLATQEGTKPLPEGASMFSANVNTPLGKEPIRMIFIFTAGRLTNLEFIPDEVLLADVKGQIAAKYGPGKILDTRREEQCVYGNGANFKVTSGELRTQWFEPLSTTEQIETKVIEYVMELCPVNLRYGKESTKILRIAISKSQIGEREKSENLF